MKIKVLVIDDCRISTFIIKSMVIKAGLSDEPAAFNHAPDALDFIDENNDKGTAFVILLDINMPEMNGWDFLKTLDRDFDTTHIHVVMVSSSTDKEDHQRAAAFDCVIDYIEKPFDYQTGLRIKNNKKFAQYFFQGQCENG